MHTTRFSGSRSIAVLGAASFLVLLGLGVWCDTSKYTAPNIPVEQQVEAGLDAALSTTVVPVYTFMRTISVLLTAPLKIGGVAALTCPDTSNWCGTGTATCSPGSDGISYDFNFAQCQVVAGSDPLMLSGNVNAIPGLPILLTLTNLSINGSPAMSGTGTIDIAACNYNINVTTSDAHVTGTVTQCDTDPYPTGNQLFISFSDFVITIVLDGSNVASATATQGGTPVSYCTISLDTDPLSSSCYAP